MFTLQEHQSIQQMQQYPKILIFWHEDIIIFFIFRANLRNLEIVYQHNIAEKYYKIGESELHGDIWGLFKNGPNITHFKFDLYYHPHDYALFWYLKIRKYQGHPYREQKTDICN